MDIAERIAGLAHSGATWVMWMLIALSIVSVAVIVERGVRLWWSRDERLWSEGEGGVRALLTAGRWVEARGRLAGSRAPEAHVVESVLEAPSRSLDALEQRITAESEFARLKLERFLTFLGTVGSNAPFLGLLGTVIGIMGAFQELALTRGQVSMGLMSEIGEALAATAVGLMVALPAVLFFNVYQRAIRDRLARAEAVARAAIALRSSAPEES